MKLKGFWLRMILVMVLAAATIIMFNNIYRKILQTEEEVCWQRLEVATNSTAGKIGLRITDNLNFLTTVADAYTLTHEFEDLNAVGEYLNSVVERTIFDRIDIIRPDESVITQGGDTSSRGGTSSYEELVAKGTHVTGRLISSFTGDEVICCVTPVKQDGQVLGLLVGTINCSTLNTIFEVFTYGEAAQLFLIDRTDGDYLMDNWHDSLDNIHNLGLRQSAYSDEMIDLAPIILNGEQARLTFVSRTNGEISYQYSAPVEGFNWTVCVVVQEPVIFANVKELEQDLFQAGLAGVLVLLLYIVWNVCISYMAARSEDKVRRLEYMRAQNAARVNFVTQMSHDIRTPMNAIVGFTNVAIKSDDLSVIKEEYLPKIKTSSDHLLMLINDVLDMSHIESGKLELKEEPGHLGQILREVTDIVRIRAEAGGLTLHTEDQLTDPCVYCDRLRFNQIVMNLLGNAVKFTHEGGAITVSSTQEPCNEPGWGIYILKVSDTGIGMSQEFTQRIFEPFERERTSTVSGKEGTGLGLTIVKSIVDAIGGSITVDSVQGQGTTFTVRLKLRQVEPELAAEMEREMTAPTKDELDPEELKTYFAGKRILLVEDNELNRSIAGMILDDAGFVVEEAPDGSVAVEKVSAAPAGYYDVVLMDIQMPIMNGYEATKAIRSLDGDRARVKIIAVTADAFSSDVEEARGADMDGHVAKPIDANVLYTTLMELNI